MTFELKHNDLIVHGIQLRPDDVIEISYSQARLVFDWGAKVEQWSFLKEKVPSVELQAFLDSIDDLITRVEVIARGEE